MRNTRYETRMETTERVIKQYAHGLFISLGVVKAAELVFKKRFL